MQNSIIDIIIRSNFKYLLLLQRVNGVPTLACNLSLTKNADNKRMVGALISLQNETNKIQ